MSLSLIDVLFLITMALLVFNGVRNGAVFSLVNLVGIPIALIIVFLYGQRFTAFLAANGLAATPLIAYIVLFFGVVLVLHVIGTFLRGVIRSVPVVGTGDALLGGIIGFGEAWLLWLLLLILLGGFLQTLQTSANLGTHVIAGTGTSIQLNQLKSWHDFYNEAITHSLFAQVNKFFVKELPTIPQPPR